MPNNHSSDTRIDSWKEIAGHLGRDIRTAMRWAKERGLPVHRVPGGGRRQPVFAYKHELDGWLKQEKVTGKESEKNAEPPTWSMEMPPHSESVVLPARREFRWKYLVAFAALAIVSLVTFGFKLLSRASHASLVARIGITTTGIQALDDTGRVIWTHTFSQMLGVESVTDIQSFTNLVRFIDLKGDGRREVLVTVPIRMGPNPTDGVQNEVDCFSNTGELLWSYVAHERFRFGNYDLERPWLVTDVFVSTLGRKPAIWVALDHNRWGNSFVVQLDPATGRDTVRFVNTGVLYKLNEIRISGRPYLLAAGFNSEYTAGSLAVIDERRPYAVSPQTDGTRHKCVSCGEGAPDYYFVFPRSEMNVLTNMWEDSVDFITTHGDEIEIEKSEVQYPALRAVLPGEKGHTVYGFHTQPTITPFSFRFDSSYDMLHRELEKEHKLDHSLEECPERLHPRPVRVWTPSLGWQDITMAPLRAID